MNSIVETQQLLPAEYEELQQCEAVIERGLQTYIEVGIALLMIRDSHLYRATHDNFESYCRERWGMSRRHAYRMLESAQVVNNLVNGLCPIGHTPGQASTVTEVPLPQNEAQARPLVPLDPPQQCEAWSEAVKSAPNGKPTARHVEDAAAKVTGKQVNGKPLAVAPPPAPDLNGPDDEPASEDDPEDDPPPFCKAFDPPPPPPPQPAPSLFARDDDAVQQAVEAGKPEQPEPRMAEPRRSAPATSPSKRSQDDDPWWSKFIHKFNALFNTLNQEGGIVNMVNKWSDPEIRNAIVRFRMLGETALRCADQLEELQHDSQAKPR